MKPSTFKSVIDVDAKQWAAWRRLTPAQRWDECARLWWETYEVRRKSKANILRSIQRALGGTGKT